MNSKNKIATLLVALATIGTTFSTSVLADSIYTVKPGDTLSQISYDFLGNVHGVSEIAQTNNIANIDVIYVGQKLNLASDGKITPATAEEIARQPEVAEIVPVQSTDAQREKQPQDNPVAGRQLTVETTAYDGVSLGGVTASGYVIKGYQDKVIAVDPSVIPLGSTVYVPGYGTAIAADTGGAISGNIIDLNMSTADAIQWGRRTVTITIL